MSKIVKIVCQIRRDIEGDAIPFALILKKSFRESMEKVFGADVLNFDPDLSQDLLDAIGRQRPEAAAELKRRAEEVLALRNACYTITQPGSDERQDIIIEELSVRPSGLYIRALTNTESCRQVLSKVEEILKDCGVSASLLDEARDDYATSTLVDLDGKIEALFSNAFTNSVLPTLVRQLKEDDSTQVVVHPYSIEMKVHQWKREPTNPVDVRPERWDFTIEHEHFDDHDKKRYKVYSRLDFAKHKNVLDSLDSALRNGECL